MSVYADMGMHQYTLHAKDWNGMDKDTDTPDLYAPSDKRACGDRGERIPQEAVELGQARQG